MKTPHVPTRLPAPAAQALLKVGEGMKRVLFLGLALQPGLAGADVVRHPANVGVALEQAQLFDAINYQGGNFQPNTSMMRPTGWFFQGATIDDRFDLVFGLGATAFSLARSAPTGSGYENEMYPAVAMVRASGAYTWGDRDHPALKFTFGAMPYKYNADAGDLGEYLFRSTPYPGTVLNSPFNLIGGAQANILGAVLGKNLAGGRWKNDLLLTSMNWTTPLYDFSAAYITSYRVSALLEVGAGVNFYRLIPATAKGTANEDAGNAYFTYGGEEYTTRADYYNNRGTAEDSARARIADSVSNGLNGGAMPAGVTGIDYYTFQGTMLMARFSLDLQPVLGKGMDLKLYGEWAMLGVRNYPVFYENPVERMPLMLGANIPTRGLLDKLSVEVQYWKNPYLNSLVEANYNAITATPDMGGATYQNLGLDPADEVRDDDLAWSVAGTKSFGKVFSVTAKAAKDNSQLMQLMGAGFPGKSYGDVMAGRDSWYYVLRLQMAL
jgi:hypothetical protein